MAYSYLYLICIKTSSADTISIFNFSMILGEHSTIHEIKISAIDHFIEFLHKYTCDVHIIYLRKHAKDKNEKKMQEISVKILCFHKRSN